MALTALVQRHKVARRSVLVLLGIFGASLFFGDGMITPAISVLSAVEGLKVAAPSLERCIGCAQLHGRLLHRTATSFKIGRHVIEAPHQFAQLFCCALLHAMTIVPRCNRLHRISEGFNGLRHLFGKVQRKPAGCKQREARHHEKK